MKKIGPFESNQTRREINGKSQLPTNKRKAIEKKISNTLLNKR